MATTRPPVRYVRNAAGLHVAYCTLGDGPPDIVWVMNGTGHSDANWMFPPVAQWLRRLASIGRVTVFDRSGTGGSDPVEPDALPTIEQWMDEVRLVMDAEGIERATLFGIDSATAVATTFAATHPNRCAGLVLFNAFARLRWAPDYPIGRPIAHQQRAIDTWLGIWGTGKQLAVTAPSVAHDDDWIEWIGFIERLSGPVRMRRPIFELFAELDVRDVLPAVHVPTLVLHRRDDTWIAAEFGRYVADHIEGARYVELDGADHYPFVGDTENVIAHVREFVTGEREEVVDDRVLATMMFTDIVDSSGLAASLGDRRWRDLLDRHDDGVRDALRRFRGREVKTTGDGFLATFDGPARAVQCARAVRSMASGLGMQVRIGLHCGELEMRGEDIGGLGVHVGARVAAEAGPGEVLVSQTVKDLTIGSGLGFDDRGAHELKGIPGEWRIYALAGDGAA